MDLGFLEIRQGRKDEAEQIFKKVSALEDYKSTYAIYLYQECRRDDATREFERLAKENPVIGRCAQIWSSRTGQQTALPMRSKLLDKALKKNPNDMRSLSHRWLEAPNRVLALAELEFCKRQCTHHVCGGRRAFQEIVRRFSASWSSSRSLVAAWICAILS